MSSFKLRPRFQYLSQYSSAEIQAKVKDHFQSNDRCIGKIIDGYIVLKIPQQDYHYWSPQLHLTLEQSQEGTIVKGLYGPNPDIWTLFTFGYGIISLSVLFIGIIGLTRVSLDMPAPILWLIPILSALALTLYIIGQFGQKLGAEQLFTLHHFLEDALKERVHVH